MTDAYGTPPAWLLDHARDVTRELRDAGEPVTPDAVADRMRPSVNDLFDAARWAFRYAAAQVIPDDGA